MVRAEDIKDIKISKDDLQYDIQKNQLWGQVVAAFMKQQARGKIKLANEEEIKKKGLDPTMDWIICELPVDIGAGVGFFTASWISTFEKLGCESINFGVTN